MSDTQTEEILDSEGNPFSPDDYYKIPSGLYMVNGKPCPLKHGDKLNGVLVIAKKFFNSGDIK